MPTWNVASKLADYSEKEIVQLKDKVIKFLRDVDYNEEKCADKHKISMLQLAEIRNRFPDDFEELYLRLKARFENVMIQVGLGKLDAKSTQVTAAMRWLERRTSEWRSQSKVTYESKNQPKSNGEGRKMLNKWVKDDRTESSVLRGQKIQ